jgi:serine phosphatase RsbU (regulator of sigma subunit)
VADIGGDWYSVVEVDEHRFALVVGDVSGHDLTAAGVMAALRYTIRTLAQLGIPPDEILDRSARELDVTTDEHFATVLIGLVDPRKQKLTLASAGHLPPLMLQKGGRPEFLKIAPGVPLGVPGPRPRSTTLAFPAGSTLIAFTDGLIEHRGQTLDAGLERLTAAAAAAAAAAERPPSPDDLIAHLVTALAGGDQEDDIAVLAVHFCPGRPTLRRRTRSGSRPPSPNSSGRSTTAAIPISSTARGQRLVHRQFRRSPSRLYQSRRARRAGR